jgi:hypothetical protein
VQNVIELEDGNSLLKLTTARYLRPSGKEIHRFEESEDQEEWGVTPGDGFALRLGDAEMERMLRDRRQRDVVRPNHNGTGEAEEPKEEPDQPEDEPDQLQEEPDQPEDEPDQVQEESDQTEDQSELPEDQPAEDPDGQQPDPDSEEASEQPAGEAPQEDDQPAAPEGDADQQSDEPPVIDRQLQMAVEYLIAELAEAE